MYSDLVVDLVKEVIISNGLKLGYVANKTKINYQRLSRLLNADTAKMTADEFVALCKFANVNLSDLTNKEMQVS